MHKANWCLLVILTINIQAGLPKNHPNIAEVPSETRYQPTWASLDTRPIPAWFDEVKIGIFIHWGVFSVPSFGGEWFWEHWIGQNNTQLVQYMKKNYPPGFSYQEFAKDFTAEFFDPDQWAELFKNAGAKYVVLTSKHHEGFALWPTEHSFGWNAKDIGPHRDLIGDLATSVRNKGLRFGVYHSLYEWFNPIYLSDKSHGFQKQEFVMHKMLPQMHELVNNYKPSILWSDGDWETDENYFQSKEFLAWLYNDSPVKDEILVNDRWGIGVYCKHGDFFSCQDRYNPGVLQNHKWENAMTLDRASWGYRREATFTSYLTIGELLETLAQTVSCGGNLLINVGPTKEGTIIPIFQERLLQLGSWLAINGEAIYGSKPWTVQNDTLTSGVWFTTDSDGHDVYATVLNWPTGNVLKLNSVIELFGSDTTTVKMLGNADNLKFTVDNKTVIIQFPDRATAASQWAWVLKITV